MSSTNRGYERHKSDYYVTPIESITQFLNVFIKTELDAFSKGIVLDPTAGGDEVNPMSYPEALSKVGVKEHLIHSIDIREDSRAVLVGDYLSIDVEDVLPEKPNVIITNPPFNLAEQIIKKSLGDVK